MEGQGDNRSNPLAMPDFAATTSTCGELYPHDRPRRQGMKNHRSAFPLPQLGCPEGGGEVSKLTRLLVYSSWADEKNYMTFRYRWGRIVLTPSLLIVALASLVVPFNLQRENWFRWWPSYYFVAQGIFLIAIGLVNACILYCARNVKHVTRTAAYVYETCVVVGGLSICAIAAAFYYNSDMCSKDKMSHALDPTACGNRIPIAPLMCTVILACLVPCRSILAVVIGCVLAPLMTFIPRLWAPKDSSEALGAKLAITLTITGAFTVLCVKRDFLQRKRFEVERLIASDNAKMGDAQRLVLATLETMLPSRIVGRLVAGLSTVDRCPGAAVCACDIGDLSLLSRVMSPSQIVGLLNELSQMFDASIERYGGEKLNSQGDRFAFTVGLLQPARSPLAAVAAATATATSFLRKCRAHPTAALLVGSKAVGPPLRTCIGFGPCMGGVVGVHSISYEAYSPALTDIDRVLPECPAGIVVATDTAAAQCPAMYAVSPLLWAAVPGVGGEVERRIALFKVQAGVEVDALQPAVCGEVFIDSSSAIEGGTNGEAEQRRYGELASDIFKWGAELQRRVVPQVDDHVELAQDSLLDQALQIHRAASGGEGEESSGSPTAALNVSSSSTAALQAVRPLGGANYSSGIEHLLKASMNRKATLPCRYASDDLEKLFESYERPFIAENMLVITLIFCVFYISVLAVVAAVGGGGSAGIPILAAGILLSVGLAALLRQAHSWLLSAPHTAHHLSALLLVILIGIAYAGITASGLLIFSENILFVLILHLGTIAACSTRFVPSVVLNLVNAVAFAILMRSSKDLGPAFVTFYTLVSFVCVFTPLETEKSMRSGFEQALVSAAVRRGLCDELAVASTILHHTLPHFIADRVLQRGESISNFFFSLPNVCVIALRLDGFSRIVSDSLIQDAAAVSTADEFLCAIEQCIHTAVAMSVAAEGAPPSLKLESSDGSDATADTDHDDVRTAEKGDGDGDGEVDILVKVKSFGDKIVIFGPLVEKAGDRHLRMAARAALHAVEHIHAFVAGKYPTCVATSMTAYDSGMVVVLGKTRCSPAIMGVAARQADLLLRAAPDGYQGVAASFAKAAATLQVTPPLAQCQLTISESSESWRVRGVGTVGVHRLVRCSSS